VLSHFLDQTPQFADNGAMHSSNTIHDVKKLYERRPYPHYPLFAKPRWQDGYLGYSEFARHIRQTSFTPASRVLCVGSGEILPYILRRWEATESELVCVDLSKRSLRRARIRCLTTTGQSQFIGADINEIFSSGVLQKASFDHIEVYGVLHHIQNYNNTLHYLSKALTQNGTMRVMVYNAKARDWIWQLNRAFRIAGLSYSQDRDIEIARRFLERIADKSPSLRSRLGSIGSAGLANNTRFADTFLHPWEARTSLSNWLNAFAKSNLSAFALFDRFGELDDLKNPLWTMPTSRALTDRAEDFRFENNLEVWLTHSGVAADSNTLPSSLRLSPLLKFLGPPRLWASFPETQSISSRDLSVLWKCWIDSITGVLNPQAKSLLAKLTPPQRKRLARLGAILPWIAKESGFYDEMNGPLHKKMEPPERLRVSIGSGELEALCQPLIKDLPHDKARIFLKRIQATL
jgi:ubiquinone/menaquinone biosynthesis C-methylase UbiE